MTAPTTAKCSSSEARNSRFVLTKRGRQTRLQQRLFERARHQLLTAFAVLLPARSSRHRRARSFGRKAGTARKSQALPISSTIPAIRTLVLRSRNFTVISPPNCSPGDASWTWRLITTARFRRSGPRPFVQRKFQVAASPADNRTTTCGGFPGRCRNPASPATRFTPPRRKASAISTSGTARATASICSAGAGALQLHLDVMAPMIERVIDHAHEAFVVVVRSEEKRPAGRKREQSKREPPWAAKSVAQRERPAAIPRQAHET